MSLIERINREQERLNARVSAEAILLERTKVAGFLEMTSHLDLKSLVAHPDFPWGDERLALAVPLLVLLQDLARGAK